MAVEAPVAFDWNAFFGTLASVTVVLGFVGIIWQKILKKRIANWIKNLISGSNEEIKKQVKTSNGHTLAQLAEKTNEEVADIKKELNIMDRLHQQQRHLAIGNRERIAVVEEKVKRIEDKLDDFIRQRRG